MARRNHSGPGRRQRTSLRSGFADRHRLRMRQLQARRTRLRGYTSNSDEEEGAIEPMNGGEDPFSRELEREPLA
ncbi:hypothetical protein [Microbulbifer sp. PSTR4-B]|jgi:hypothetical protein|uniref:hypothetical protein n=1 Tax=unclassified Microbulbifer TaxID=2619833 RepID=UPI00403927C4